MRHLRLHPFQIASELTLLLRQTAEHRRSTRSERRLATTMRSVMHIERHSLHSIVQIKVLIADRPLTSLTHNYATPTIIVQADEVAECTDCPDTIR